MTNEISINEAAADAPKKASSKKPVSKKKGAAGTKKRVTNAKPATRGKAGSKGKTPKKDISGARQGSKTAKVMELMQRADGATPKDIMKATGWQPHSVRGFISTLGSKGAQKIDSSKKRPENGLTRSANHPTLPYPTLPAASVSCRGGFSRCARQNTRENILP